MVGREKKQCFEVDTDSGPEWMVTAVRRTPSKVDREKVLSKRGGEGEGGPQLKVFDQEERTRVTKNLIHIFCLTARPAQLSHDRYADQLNCDQPARTVNVIGGQTGWNNLRNPKNLRPLECLRALQSSMKAKSRITSRRSTKCSSFVDRLLLRETTQPNPSPFASTVCHLHRPSSVLTLGRSATRSTPAVRWLEVCFGSSNLQGAAGRASLCNGEETTHVHSNPSSSKL
ncbi:hypothetical protein CROQUDRAFT_101955 [Cronartium quercuum f. sp. fusiforme G11]|uniref:Uncharacterized protein n=1 Tax=Cronartium quercuum f. sp. fusiforme G11 TaxID=708437 RepID=A0A9P6T4Y1_9BASI|nr:hypothetical protein CROQUDRAFT_101955 [Cronartium quercuum f. sp. fusiforme G11]